ncbi:MAG: efflux RND transporter permease subunit [Gemmatimonadaceae bacterium]
MRDALIEAGRTRLRPIMMTTLALIAGMMPVALGRGEGADFRAPLGRAVMSGVVASTVLSLLIIPTVHEIFDEWRGWLARKFFPATHLPKKGSAVGAGAPSVEPAAGD